MYDVGAAVTDTALVINTLRGLNSKFSETITVLGAQKPPPSFLYIRSYLMQEEKRIRHTLQMEASTALLAAGSNSSTARKSSTNPPSPQPNGGGDRRKKRKAYNSRNKTSGSSSSNNSITHVRLHLRRPHRSGRPPTTHGRVLFRRGH